MVPSGGGIQVASHISFWMVRVPVRTLRNKSFTIVEHHINSRQPDDPTSDYKHDFMEYVAC